jgi:hypothetical protein
MSSSLTEELVWLNKGKNLTNKCKANMNPTSEPIPDITKLVQPTILGDVATYFFFTAGGLFVGGETGLLTGSFSGGRKIMKDPEARTRIETAFRKFRADALRQEATKLDGGQSVFDKFI